MPITPYRGFDVTIDGSSLKSYGQINKYELDVLTDLNHIYNSQTGRALLNDFKGTGRSIKIVPEPEKDGLRAKAHPENYRDALPRGEKSPQYCFVPEWLPFIGQEACSLSILRGKEKPIEGTGRGTNAVIEFSPSKYHGNYAGSAHDEVLFHEMVHAVRSARGINARNRELSEAYDNEDEFVAILITNIYMSEQQRTVLRKDHAPEQQLRKDHHRFDKLETDTDETFLPHLDEFDYRYSLVNKLVTQDSMLAGQLQLVPSKFNPIRRFFQLRYPNRISG